MNEQNLTLFVLLFLQVTRADAAWAAPGGTYIPGLAAPEGPSKSQKRKEKKKKSEAEAQARKEAEEALAEAAAAAPVDPEKRKKQLVKKLKQIEGIREKQAGGATLNEDQLEKLEAEAALRAELATLG
jgi:translation initiation factor 2A